MTITYSLLHGEDPEFKKQVTAEGYNPVLIKVKKLIKAEQIQTLTKLLSENNYELPSWAEKQADLLGQIRTLDMIIGLLSFVKD